MKFTILICLLAAALAMLSMPAEAKIYHTGRNFGACLNESSFDQWVSCEVKEDTECLLRLMGSKRCVVLKEGLPVYLEEYGLGTIVIRPKGMTIKLWTYREAIKD